MLERNEVYERLKKNKLTQVWLINQLREHGIVTERSEISAVFAGTRNGLKVDAIIKTSKFILDEYEKMFAPKS